MKRGNLLAAVLFADLMANLLVAWGPASELRAAAALLILALAPGYVLVEWLLGRDPTLTLLERLLYGLGAGFALWVTGVLALSYLPGGLEGWQVLLTFNAVTVLLTLLTVGAWRRSGRGWDTLLAFDSQTTHRGLVLAALASLLLLGGFFRLTRLDYSEFQGDEAKVILRAAGVVQGYEEVLLTYRKGPQEILLPAGQLALGGTLTEAAARLPFAVASVATLLVVFLLGRRLGGAWAGWLAAVLLAVDGYHIGHTRIVQYQALIFLMAALTVDLLYRLWQRVREDPTGRYAGVVGSLLLAALCAATGLLAHYEGVFALVPALFLLWRIGRRVTAQRAFWGGIVGALALGAAVVASFYVPFLLNPALSATVDRLGGDVVGAGASLYNHLEMFAGQGSFYTFAYLFALEIVVAVAALLAILLRGRRWFYGLLAAFALAVVLVTVLAPQRLIWGGVDVTPFLMGAVLLLPIFAPPATFEERLVWSWLGLPFLAANFIIQDPNTHFYILDIPWLLIVGIALASGGSWVRRRWGHMPATLAAGAGAALLLLAMVYTYAIFLYTPRELVRLWDERALLPAWFAPSSPVGRSQFGMPHHSGWKAVAGLFAEEAITGTYASNVRSYLTDWYTRGAENCEEEPDWVFLDLLEWDDKRARWLERMGDQYQRWGTIEIGGEPRIDLYRRQSGEIADPPRIDGNTYQAHFDAEVATAFLPLMPSTVTPHGPPQLTPEAYRFGDEIELTGFQIHSESEGGASGLPITLVWQARQAPRGSYRVALRLVDGTGAVVGERDAWLACLVDDTTEWEPGARAAGFYRVPVAQGKAVTPATLLIEVYDAADGRRLPATAGNGAPIGTTLALELR